MNWYRSLTAAVFLLCIAATGYAQSSADAQKSKEITVQAREAFLKVHPSARVENYSLPPDGNIACTINGLDGTQRVIFAIRHDGSVAEDVLVPDGFPKNGLQLFRERHPDATISSVTKFNGAGNDGFTIRGLENGNIVSLSIAAEWTVNDDKMYQSIAMDEVPEPVINTLNEKYPGQKQSNPRRVTNNGVEQYCMDIEGTSPGIDLIIPYVSPDGKMQLTSYRITGKRATE